MGDLPAARVQPARPFLNSGVDYCGPVWVHYKVRGKRPQKAYVAVFCCFATKAIHLELVSDLTTEAFIGALRRFIGRRGHCKTIYCDNAKNFVGASNQLNELIDAVHSAKSQEKIISECSMIGIEFKFIPPRAPHFGGLWEAAVKSTKLLLQKGTASASLTYEELETLLIEVEAILNSRPLTQLSNDPNDLAALTPGHFLIGEPLTNAVDVNADSFRGSLLTRWKLVSHIKQEFWRRWSSEYLTELQQRYKWQKRVDNLKPGTIVVIKEDNAPVMKWPLGRITQTFTGDDGLVRVAEVKTASGVFKRSIHKLAPLPCDINDDTEVGAESGEQLKTSKSIKRPHERQLDNQASTTTDITSKKKTRVEPKTSLAALLLTCLIFPLVPAKQIEVGSFGGKPGLHFEGIATTRFVTSKWNIVVYYDLQSYSSELATFSSGISTLSRLCNQTNQAYGCEETIRHFRLVEFGLNIDNELISSHQRHKRGAFNVIGNMANSLFGVLDSDYAEHMSYTIKNIEFNQESLKRLLRNQTSIIDSTINIMKTDQSAISQKFNGVDEDISRLTNGINTLGNDVHRLIGLQKFTILASQLTLMSARLKHIQTYLLDVVTSLHHSKISTLLLTPDQFKVEITRIKTYLPPPLQLPMQQQDIASFYRLMSVRSRMVNNHIIFRIQLPLTNDGIFTIYHVIPIPIILNSTIFAIKPTSDLLAVNQHHDLFTPMEESEMT